MTTTAYRLSRDAVRVAGPDAESFLQGQLSQDLGTIPLGQSAWSLLLQPQGKVDAFVRINRVHDDEFVLDTDGGWGQRVLERLQRFKMRVKVDLEVLDWKCVALRTSGDGELPPAGAGGAGTDGTVVVAAFAWPGFAGVDLLGPDPQLPVGAVEGEAAEYERRRIEAGVPVMGRELDERTIPAEAGVVDRAVSFTKGCYTGQELVARIDSRGGNVPRHLRLVRVPGVVPPAGASLVVGDKTAGDKVVGVLTSVAPLDGGGAVALAYVGRAVEMPAELELRGDGVEPQTVTVTELPPTPTPEPPPRANSLQ